MNFFSKNKEYHEIHIKLPWVEKYRPKEYDDILLDPFIKDKIFNILKNKIIPNMIITGEPGTGKTSTILFLAKELYKNYYDDYVLELNASDDRGLSIINNTILPFSKKKILVNKNLSLPLHKLVILDEADSITSKAQNLLSNIMSEYKYNTSIVYICNDCSQIIESIQSKCIIIKYPKINYANLFKKIKDICINENITYTDKGIEILLFVSDQDIRQAINNLECIFYSFNNLTEESVYKLIDKPKPYFITELILQCYKKDYIKVINIIKDLNNKGYTPNDILLTFMKYIFEYKNDLDDKSKLDLYKIISSSYIKINNGVDSLLQLCGCISKVYLYIQNK